MFVIIGASGFLGSYIQKAILEKTQETVLSVSRSGSLEECHSESRVTYLKCDITKPDNIANLQKYIDQEPPVNIIYLAAYHNPDMVEKNPRVAWDINITALSVFLNTVHNVRTFFYASTDSVYGNSTNWYHFKEDDCLNPVNRYGVQKSVCEKLVTAYGYNVVRYPFLIGPSLAKNKKHFYDKILEQISSGNPIEMFQDSYRSSLDFRTAANLLIDLVIKYDPEMPSILNVSGDEDLSKYDIGLRIAEKAGFSKELIIPVNTEENTAIFEASRAKSTLLDNQKVKDILNVASILIDLN